MSDEEDGLSDELLDIFNDMLENNGVAASSVSDGTLVAFKLDKLLELVEIATSNENKKVMILIAEDLHTRVTKDNELKN